MVLEAAGKLDLTPRQKELYELLVRISGQAVEKGEDGRYRLRQGVAKDRIISTTDSEMRHGRKSGGGSLTAPKQLVSYSGVVLSEYSSGTRRYQGGITKSGGAYLRRVIVEAAWNYRRLPHVGSALLKKRSGSASPRSLTATASGPRSHRQCRHDL